MRTISAPSLTPPTAGDALTSTSGREIVSDHAVDVFKALGHPVRLDIMTRMMDAPELACTELEQTLPIAKSTISYHIKLLYRAGLINVRKDGRHFYYTPRWDEVERRMPGLVGLLQDRIHPRG